MKPFVAVIVLLMTCVSPISDVSVLCIGESGHMQLDPFGFLCCATSDQHGKQDVPSLLGMEDECGSCIDIFFPVDSIDLHAARTSSPVSIECGQVSLGSLSTFPIYQSDQTSLVGVPDDHTLHPPLIGLRLSASVRC